MNNALLKIAYTDLLKDIDTRYLENPDIRKNIAKGLSGLFLPSVSDDYQNAKNKVMIIGSETAGWEPLAKAKNTYDDFRCIENYIDRAMQKHQGFFKKELGKKTGDKGHTFHNFSRATARVAGEDGLVYSNLFCFDWHGRSPIRSPEFKFIKNLSAKLLDAQIKILQPDYIIFANGISSAKYRRDFFPVGEGLRCTNSKSYPEIISSHYLWEFMLDDKIRCFRIHHPSSRSKRSKDARLGQKFALKLLAQAIH